MATYKQPKGHPPPMRTVVKPRPAPLKRPPISTPQRVIGSAPPPQTAQQWADAQAQRIVDEQLQAIKDQQASYNQSLLEQAQQQAAQAQKFAAMVQSLGIPSRSRGSTAPRAGHRRDGAGLRRVDPDTAAADAARQTRMVSGTGQEGAVRNEGTNMGDVVYGVGGYIPGKTMGEVGSAFAADAAKQPGFMLEQKIGDAQSAYNAALQEGNKSFLDAIMQAKTSKTSISSDLYKQRVDQNTTDRKMRLDQFNEDRNYWLKMQAYYQSIGKLKLSKDAASRAQQAENRYRNETMGRDADGNVAPGYVQLPNGAIVKRSDLASDAREKRYRMKDKGLAPDGTVLPGFKKLPNGTIVPRYKPSTKKAGGKGAAGLTPNAQADVLQGVLGQEDDMTKALPQIAKVAGYDAMITKMGPPTPATQKVINATRAKIAKELWDRYSPRAITPASKKALRAMIARVIKAYNPSTGGGLTEGLLPDGRTS